MLRGLDDAFRRRRALLESRLSGAPPSLPEFGHFRSDFSGLPLHVVRVSSTGEEGYELWAPWEDNPGKTKAMWESLLARAAGLGAVPCGTEALEMLRIEASIPRFLMVDTISSLASIDYRHDEWGVDVTVAGSQKGLMLPPGLSFNAVSEKALAASEIAALPRSFWSWAETAEPNQSGYFPYTPATNLFYGLREAISILVDEEALDNVFRRHARHGEARLTVRCMPGV